MHIEEFAYDLQHFQQGFFIWDVPTFNERVVREAVLNAVSHRDYRHGGSIFVRQYPRRIEIVSPGGFPAGITPENILRQQNPRNRRIAEALGKCGLVERAGQGFDRIFRECIQQSKPLPDFSHTDDHFVWLTLHGEIQDPEFLRFLEEIGREQVAAFGRRSWAHPCRHWSGATSKPSSASKPIKRRRLVGWVLWPDRSRSPTTSIA
ncbi:MAG: hypothetical protein F4Z30_13255 [Gemmatimonadetes bacterium]|nr:hypothetical protein [Gemmatimonadota bacterium]